MLGGVLLCFLLSGFAALLYQTAWLRQFSLVFGTSELAVATVLAAYMAGLAAGAAVAGRWVGRLRRPIRVYGLLEAGIAVSALAVPWLLAGAGLLYGWVLGDRPDPPDAATLGQPIFYLVVSFLTLAIPTGLMGATLPLLTRHAVTRNQDVGPRVALLYATNTLGAVLGALATGFALLPALGLQRTVLVGAALNGAVFVLAAAISRRAPDTEPEAEGPSSPKPRRRGPPPWILPVMLVSGATSFAYEVLWTRLLTHVLGGSLYAFTAMLATFLSGIALGGALAGRLATSRERAIPAFAGAQAGIALLSAAVYTAMGPLLPEGRSLLELVLFAVAVMLPATLFIGATFPLAVRILARDAREASVGTARVYAWNTVGAIAGAVATGFWLLPALGFGGTARLAIACNAALAALALLGVAPSRRRATALAAAAAAGVALFYQPARPEAVLAPTQMLTPAFGALRETFYAVGRSATVLVVDDGEFHWLFTNGLAEASIASRGSPPARDAQAWLTALAAAARPEAGDMLVVGLGGGSALAGVPSSIARVDVVEIEPEVVEANRSLQSVRAYDPLADPRVNVIVNDARNALRLTRHSYAAIVSQPSHPWTAGASHLFTREFARAVRERLTPDGVFVQWISNDFLTAPLLRSMASTLLAEFEHVRLYRPTADDLLFLASPAPLAPELAWARRGGPPTPHRDHFHRVGLGTLEDLLAALVADTPGLRAFAADAPPITDDRNLMATHSRGQTGLGGPSLDEIFSRHDPLLDLRSWVHRDLGTALRVPHLGRRLIRMGKVGRADALRRRLEGTAVSEVLAAELLSEAGRPAQARDALDAALERDPDLLEARYLRLRPALAEGRAAELSGEALAGLRGSALEVARAWQLFDQRRWQDLALLDDGLAASDVADAWYPDAAFLRARWRIRTGRDRRRHASEALRILDDALLQARDLRMPLERLRIATRLDDEFVRVESARSVVALYRAHLEAVEQSGGRLPPAFQAQMRQTLSGVLRVLEAPLGPETAHRAAQVRAVAQGLLEQLGTPLAPSG